MIKKLSTKIVYENKWMKVKEDEVEFSNGHKGIYGVVDKSDFVLIIPFDGKSFHLVEQFRYPVKQNSIEFPQGKHEDDPNKDPLKLAKAELSEETGLVAKDMIQVGFLYNAPGYSNQGFHIYFATSLTQKENDLEITEAGLKRVIMDQNKLEKAITEGDITDAPTISAYGLLRLKNLL